MIPRPSAQTRPPGDGPVAGGASTHPSYTTKTEPGLKRLQIPDISLPNDGSNTAKSGNFSSREDDFDRSQRLVRLASARDSQTDTSGDPLPFPPRPGQQTAAMLSNNDQQPVSRQHRSRRRATAIPHSVTLSPPTEASRYFSGLPVDYHPWTNSDSSNRLTSGLIKAGVINHYLIGGTSGDESRSARSALLQGLRGKSGCAAMASLVCAALEWRQAAGKVRPPSAFKLPPRVGLNDGLREAWLLDLANPKVPMKKSIKRIPHGFKGKGLLEEFMNRKIIPARAVVVAKCVGLNEMRPLKRKGAGTGAVAAGFAAEARWIKEWTLQVQQFVESVVANCGTHGWRANIEYAIRLATSFYHEQLLDDDQYLDWIVSSLRDSITDNLPFWLMLSQMYLKDLIVLRRRGQPFIAAIVHKIVELEEANEVDICKPLYQQLRQMVTSLLLRARSCFIGLEHWTKAESLLTSLATIEGLGNASISIAANSVIRRNKALLMDLSKTREGVPASRRVLIRFLDAAIGSGAALKFSMSNLWTHCNNTGLNTEEAVRTTIAWACSHFRTGDWQVYLAARLVRHWKRANHDVDSTVLSFLKAAAAAHANDLDRARLCAFVAELCRSRTFSLGRYFQWLIATGATDSSSTGRDNFHTTLLKQLPLNGASSSLLNLRRILLDEGNVSEDLFSGLEIAIDEVLRSTTTPIDLKPFSDLDKQSEPVKSEVAQLIRTKALAVTQRSDQTEFKHTTSYQLPPDKMMTTTTLAQFHFFRSILESIGHIATLADVLDSTLLSDDSTVVAACADTLNLHATSFAAIGALPPLYRQLMARHQRLRVSEPADRTLIVSVLDLSIAIGADRSIQDILQADLTRCDQQNAVQMCSPASDGMLEAHGLQGDGVPVVEEEIEKALSGGSNIDEATTARTFSKVVQFLSKLVTRTAATSTATSLSDDDFRASAILSSWLLKLKMLNQRRFEQLASEWLTGVITEQSPGNSQFLSYTVPLLVGIGALSLAHIVASTRKMLETLLKIAPKQAANPAMNLMAILTTQLPRHPLIDEHCWYRYRVERFKALPEALNLLRPLLEAAARSTKSDHQEYLPVLLSDPALHKAVQDLVLKDLDAAAIYLGIDDHGKSFQASDSDCAHMVHQATENLVDTLVDPQGDLQLSTLARKDQLRKLIDSANDLSIPFCQLKIRSLLRGNLSRADPVGVNMDVDEDDLEAVLLEMLRSVSRQDYSQAELLGGFGNALRTKVCGHVEQQLLMAAEDLRQVLEDQSRDLDDKAALQRYISVMDATTQRETKLPDLQQVLVPATDRLRLLLDILNGWQSALQSTWRLNRVLQACVWIEAVLHLCVLRQHVMGLVSPADLYTLCEVLCSLVLHPLLQSSPDTVDAIADLIALMSDGFPADLRARLSRIESHRHNHDPLIVFFFGSTPAQEARLTLVTVKRPAAASPSTGTSATIGSSINAASPAASTPGPSPLSHQVPQQSPPSLQRQPSVLQRGHTSAIPLPPKPGSAIPPRGQPRQAQQAWPPAQAQRPGGQMPNQQQQNTVVGQHKSSGSGPGTTQQQQQTIAPGQLSRPLLKRGFKEPLQFDAPLPYVLKPWELLPSAGSSSGRDAMVNDTAISLSLFGARKVG